MKPQTAALGFRVKSGWAVVAVLTGSIDSPQLRDCRMIELSDPQHPETRQPYHAAMGKLELNTKKINRRRNIVQNIIKLSISKLLADYRRKGHVVTRASLVVGSQRDPATIANPHIRAHSLEGQLFRSTLKQALDEHAVRTFIFREHDAYDKATRSLKKSSVDIRRRIQNFGRHTDGPWRADQKLAALAAWVALATSSPSEEGSGDGNIRCD